MLATSIAKMSTGITGQHLLSVTAWTPGRQPTTLDGFTTQGSSQFLLANFSYHVNFLLYPGESVERLPPSDTAKIEKAYQEFCG